MSRSTSVQGRVDTVCWAWRRSLYKHFSKECGAPRLPQSMNKKVVIEKRESVRLDSVFPIEFQVLNSEAGVTQEVWHQGFTADIGRGGLSLSVFDLDTETLVLFSAKRPPHLSLKIHIPIVSPPVSAVASIAWVKQEEASPVDSYVIGLKYEKIDRGDLKRVMRFVSLKAAVLRLTLAGVIVLFLGLTLSAYFNLRLFSYNKNLIEKMVNATRDFSTAQGQLGSLKRQKNTLEAQFLEISSKIKLTVKELNNKIESLEQDLSSLRKDRAQDLERRALEINRLKSTISKLEEEKVLLEARMAGLQKDEDAAALRLQEAAQKKMILEKASFEKMYQWLKVHQNPRTGLLASFEGDSQLEDQAFTYDQALAALAFTYFGDYELANKIFNFYLTKAAHEQGYYNGYYASTAEPAEYIIHSGPNLWLGIAVLQYINISGDKKYLPIAENIASWLADLQGQDRSRGLRGGPGANWFSTEHNLDAFAFFNMFYQLTNKPAYSKAASDIFNWLKSHAYDSPNVPVKRGRGDATIATDTYAWSIASLGPQRLKAAGMDPEGIMKFAEDNFGVTVEYERPGKERILVKGFDFAKRLHEARGGVISSEWTAQMVLSYKILSAYFSSKSDSIKGRIYQDKANGYLEELTKLIVSSPSYTGQGQGCLPYASCDFVDTGHGWTTPKGKNTGSVAATAFAIFAYYGFNPLELSAQ